MLKESGHHPTAVLVALGALTWHLDVWFQAQRIQAFAFAGVVLITTVWALYRYQARASNGSDGRPPFTVTVDWALVVAGAVYLGLGTRYLLRLRALPMGFAWTLITLFIVWISDTAAYFVGRAWGEHKIAPAISPGKSWEGYTAQVISGMLSGGIMVALWPILGLMPVNVPVWQGVVLGALVSILSPLGDFFVSMIKRESGVKDTSRLIPGHGGVLDRLDTPLWAGILAFVFLTFVR
jgi:phosphatidate cytidylyltransferase